ncbi:hypothetical protein NDU88_002804 [Pleurodeles waltl]|uniref:Cholesterol 24-hydroxylase n=1 Tax=Pleurodeles waltl TaxID=8319 RepID=A0AAV7MP42_PLEWA|nr:hypothetical protein NDU88_002804 [Pleurodeles waltl]
MLPFLYPASPFLVTYCLLPLCTAVFVVCAAYCCYVEYIHRKFDHIPGPPRDSFLLGHAPTLNKSSEGHKVIHDKFLEWAEQYGPIFRINIFHRVVIYAISREAVKEFLLSPKYLKDPQVYDRLFSLFGVRFMGKGLLTDTDHEHWYKQRRIFDPAFSRIYLKEIMGTFNEKAEHLMERLMENAEKGQKVGMHAVLNLLTLDVITKAAFGLDLNLLGERQTPLPHAVETALLGFRHVLEKPYTQHLPQYWSFVRKVKEAAGFLRQTGKECIQKRKWAVQNGEEVPQDILTRILKSAEEQGNYDDELMLDNFITFFIAGQETTANQLAFTIMELGRLPHLRDRLKDEVDEVLGQRRDVDFEDLGKFNFMSQVLKESLRLYPPGPGTSRYLKEDAVIEGVRIPGGASVILNTYIMGRMEKFFKDPFVFNPERFHPDAPKPDFCYFPFVLGPRSCLGQVFSQMEAKVVLAKLLQRFEFTLAPGQTCHIMNTSTLRPRDGVECILKVRGEDKKKQ